MRRAHLVAALLQCILGICVAVAPPTWVQELRRANCAQPTEDVQEMYEDLPYPWRDPADEAPGQPFAVDAASTPAAISHHLFQGRVSELSPGRPFRILVAGGGTGDATVMAAVSFDAASLPAEIYHVDLSAASIAVAKQRLAVHNLSSGVRVVFLQRSFLELRVADLGGQVDFVNSAGVVHHLANPAEGLRALRALLAPAGGLFLMVYGEVGRSGVYDMQDMWRLSKLSRREALGGPLQALLRSLPGTNRLALNRRMMSQKVRQGDPTTLSDLLVHHCDHAYTVASLLELLASADLELLDFADPDKYAVPGELLTTLKPFLEGMPRLARFHFTELLRADIYAHSFWAAPASEDSPRTDADADVGPAVDAAAVLCPSWAFVGYSLVLPADDRLRCFQEGTLPGAPPRDGLPPATCSIYLDQLAHEQLPCLAVPLLELLDCKRTVAELHHDFASAISSSGQAPPELSSTVSLAAELYGRLSTQGERQVFVLRGSFQFRRPPWRQKRVSGVVVKRDWDALIGEGSAEL